MLTFPLLLALASIHLTAVMTPGPNFLAVTQTALAYSQRAGLWTVRGIATGSSFYVTLGLVGVAALLSQSETLLLLIRAVGAIYFAYTGWKMLRAAWRTMPVEVIDSAETDKALSSLQAYQRGVITALSNPAAMMYFLSLFTGFVPLTAAPYEKLWIGLLLVGITFGWYSIVALTFSRQRIRRLYQRSIRWMNAAFGLLWLFMALKLAGV